MQKLTKRYVESLETKEKDYRVWDSEIKGFGVKVTPKGRKVYFYKYRSPELIQRKPSIGAHGSITCEQARGIAQKWAHEVSQGNDPAVNKNKSKSSPTVTELTERYMQEYAIIKKKPRSVELDRLYIDSYIIPYLGKHRVSAVTRNEITGFHQSMKDTPTQANRIMSTLSKMFNLAEIWGLREEHSNPVRGVEKYREESRERYLSAEERITLLRVLDEVEEDGSESSGLWQDFASGDKGNFLQLHSYRFGVSENESRQELYDFRKYRNKVSEYSRTKPENSGFFPVCKRLWSEAIPATDSEIARNYFASRNIAIQEECWELRLHPAAWESETRRKHPALLALIQDISGNPIGLHRTYLLLDGNGKAAIRSPKKILGKAKGGVIRLGGVSPVIGIAEGMETALAVRQCGLVNLR